MATNAQEAWKHGSDKALQKMATQLIRRPKDVAWQQSNSNAKQHDVSYTRCDASSTDWWMVLNMFRHPSKLGSCRSCGQWQGTKNWRLVETKSSWQ
eukprot:5974292-Amphidinium_carterae.2